MHKFDFVHAVADECVNAAVLEIGQFKTRFFTGFTSNAVFRAFAFFEFPADSDPFVVIDVVLLFDAVQKEVRTVLFDVAKRRVEHGENIDKSLCK